MSTSTNVNRESLKTRRGSKPGFTMLEFLGVLFMGALLMVGAIMLIRTAMDSSRLSNSQQALTAMSIQIKGHFSGVRDYTGLSNPLAIKAGLVPQVLLRGDAIQTPWGGAVTLAPAANAAFTITWAGLSDSVCTRMATYQPELWQGISINGTAVAVDTAVAQANTSCTGNANTIIYTDR